MQNLVEVNYQQTGRSTNTDEMGMREMQARAFEARNAQHLLIKAPPASGKSRALMFLALDKMHNQGVAKTIVAVPERSIGASFASTELTEYGFFADWELNPKWDLCSPDSEEQKAVRFQQFLSSDDHVLVCAHATLRNAFEAIDTQELNNILIAIDEFHHVSAHEDNKLGAIRSLPSVSLLRSRYRQRNCSSGLQRITFRFRSELGVNVTNEILRTREACRFTFFGFGST